ncbi:hypothetical protein EUX98_g7842 [Antrodiella citrinella]|uniref:Uncharacterized protein n=1 Tax=Antrodiella citrinella TaxID=2447956 RepID=A0A4S4MKI2_9APHY|nr:hypothetical protein EUX98_g7842 [Antrodiella citrinella]
MDTDAHISELIRFSGGHTRDIYFSLTDSNGTDPGGLAEVFLAEVLPGRFFLFVRSLDTGAIWYQGYVKPDWWFRREQGDNAISWGAVHTAIRRPVLSFYDKDDTEHFLHVIQDALTQVETSRALARRHITAFRHYRTDYQPPFRIRLLRYILPKLRLVVWVIGVFDTIVVLTILLHPFALYFVR